MQSHYNNKLKTQLYFFKKWNSKVTSKTIIEYKFIYEDLKQQLKQMPYLQHLLKLTEKSTRKLQCLNLYSITDKKDFDLQIQEAQIMKEVVELYRKIHIPKQKEQQTYNQEQIKQITQIIAKVKQKNIQVFDLLSRHQEQLNTEIEKVEYMLNEDRQEYQIKEEDQFQEQYMKQSSNNANPNQQRINTLKKQIQEIGTKIAKINNGRGSWYQTDHTDFVKIYNKCAGNAKKIVDQCIKILGMKNIQVMDHLQIYQNYLQLEKQKKIITQEYKQIKLYEKVQEDQKKQMEAKQTQQKRRMNKKKEIQQQEKKKQLIQKFKQKKMQQKTKMLQQQQKKQKQKLIKVPLPPAKKKEIIERNQKYILQKQNNFKKTKQMNQEKKKTSVRNFSREKQVTNLNLMPEHKSSSIAKNRNSLKQDNSLK